jgi:hypothetical protein
MTGSQITFSRRLELPLGDSLDAISRWQPEAAALEEGSTTLEPAEGAPRYRLSLRLRRFGRSVPMELTLSPWAGPATTHLELVPLRTVRPTRRYFRRGRSLLDDAVSTMCRATSREEAALPKSA